MNKPRVLYVADKIEHAHLFQEVLAPLEAEVQVGSPMQLTRLLASPRRASLLIFDASSTNLEGLPQLVNVLVETKCASLLLIVEEDQLTGLKFTGDLLIDFVVGGAGVAECRARVLRLLSECQEQGGGDIVKIDNMEINLATYQVTIDNEPVDLTYLEYALLSFLITHSGQTYSRDALLQHVWGIDYFGGSRTVDVHVRRVRSKLGSDLSQRLETIRGVGYLWRN